MRYNKDTFSIIEEIIIKDIKGKIFLNLSGNAYETGLIFSQIKKERNNTITNAELLFFFLKSINVSMNKIVKKDCTIISQSTKFTEEIKYNKFLISRTEVIKKTRNLFFSKSKLFHDEKRIAVFSNSIWENN